MPDHILSRRARFWLALSDAARWAAMPWRVELWLILRANAAIPYEPASGEPGREPF
jgi:hypothetical protein